jgi:phage tail-like protein
MTGSNDRVTVAPERQLSKPVGTVAAPTAALWLLDYLPAIYHERDEPEAPSFLALFLRAFERILLGGAELKQEDTAEDPSETIEDGLEEEIAALPLLLGPWETPEEFLPWLASWAALSYHPYLSIDRRRRLLANIIPLYRLRGTRKYMEDILRLCVDAFISVSDAEIPGFQVQSHSTVGVDTYIGGGPPHFFSVRLVAPKLNQHEKEIQVAIAHSIIELAKPAHTFYELSLVSPRMQVGVHSTVGLDTVLGPASSQSG